MSSSDTVDFLRRITSIYQLSFDSFLLLIGLISNVSLIFIFTTLKIFRGNRSAYYLIIEAVSNIGLYLALFPSNIAGYAFNQNPARLSIVWCKIQLMCTYVFGLLSLFATCFLAFDQYLSTNHRSHWRQLNTLQLAHRLIFASVVIAIFHGILFLVFAGNGEVGCSIYHPIAKIYFSFFFFPILITGLPFIFSLVFSLLAYRNVRRIIRRQIPLVRRRLDRQMTAIALGRVVSFTTFGVPFVIYSIVELNISVGDGEIVKKAILDLLFTIVSTTIYANFGVNFYLFVIISSRFRHQVKHFFKKRRLRLLATEFKFQLRISRTNEVSPDSDQRPVSNVIVESV